MSVPPAPKKVLAVNIDETTAPPHDLLVSYASSIPKGRLLTLKEWLRAGQPTADYTGPKPTYRLKLNWTTGEPPARVLHHALERCFGVRGVEGWGIWIEGDQLNLIIGDLRKAYLTVKALNVPEVEVLDLWVDGILQELKRIHEQPSAPAVAPWEAEITEHTSLHPTETQQRRSSRSPSQAAGLNDPSHPRVIPTEIVGKPSGSKTLPPFNTTRTGANSGRHSRQEQSPRPPTMSPASLPMDAPCPVSPVPDSFIPSTSVALSVPHRHDPGRGKAKMHLAPETQQPPLDEADYLFGSPNTSQPNVQNDAQSIHSDDDDIGQNPEENGDEHEEYDDVSDVDEDEDDADQADEYQPNRQSTSNRSTKGQRVIELSADEEDEPEIFRELGPGPSRVRKGKAAVSKAVRNKQAIAKAQAHQATTSTRHQVRPTTSKQVNQTTSKRLTSSKQAKRKAADSQQSQQSTNSKRPRVHELNRQNPHTPESSIRSAKSVPATATPSQAGTELRTDVDTPTPQAQGNKSAIWLFYLNVQPTHGNNHSGECRGCGKLVRGAGSSNFINHQRICPGLLEAHRKGLPGLMCPPPEAQTTFETKTGGLIRPFDQDLFLAAVMKWVIVTGLPFTTIQNSHLREAFQVANPDARLQSARSLSRKVEDTFDIVNDRVLAVLREEFTVLHYTHDSWTNTGRKHCFFGVYVSWVNENFEYKSVLLRLLHMQGSHSGERIGNGIFDLFNNVVGVSENRVGPGTADNASNNINAAERLQDLYEHEHEKDMPARDFVGCMCHIANLAAAAYIGNEATLGTDDYAYAEENIPTIKVIGEDEFHDPALRQEGEGDEDDSELGNYGRTAGDEQVSEEEEEDEEVDDDGTALSPVDKVHRLAIYVHASARRKDEFEKYRADLDSDTPRGMLPLKDIKTRWNSKEAAIARVLRLRKCVTAFCNRQVSRKCPRFVKKDFEALEIIQPSLKIFLNLTLVHSEVGANAHRIIPDLVDAIEELGRIHSHPSVSAARVQSCEAAVAKLQKYLFKFLKNRWVCAAMLLDPTVREEGLTKLLTRDYKARKYLESTVEALKRSLNGYQQIAHQLYADESQDEFEVVRKPERPNRYASTKYEAGGVETACDMTDPWACYNSATPRFATFHGEPILTYWKRMSEYKEMRLMAQVARDVLGLASSSASVERLFSHAGHVLGKKRGSLSAKLLAKQTMLRMWEQQGYLNTGDLRACADKGRGVE